MAPGSKIERRWIVEGGAGVNRRARAGCEKAGAGFSLKSRTKYLESIRFYDFGSIQSKIIVI
jgi:hypothetical protein